MRFLRKNCLLITAIVLTSWPRAGGVRVMNMLLVGRSADAANDTQEDAPAEQCRDAGLLQRLEQLSAWRQRVFEEALLDDVLLQHSTADLSYLDRLELVNRVMVDVLLQAIPDNSSPSNRPHAEPPLLAPRKGPAYRRPTIHVENLQNISETLSSAVEDQIDSHLLDETTEIFVLANETSLTLNGEAHILGVSQPSSVHSKNLKFPTSGMESSNKSVGDKTQENSHKLETAIHDHERNLNKSTENVTSVYGESLIDDQNIPITFTSGEIQYSPTVKMIPPLAPQNSSYLSVFAKTRSREFRQNSSSPTSFNTVYLNRSSDDDLDSNLSPAVKLNSSVGVNASRNGTLSDLPKDEASLRQKQMSDTGNKKTFGSVSSNNHLESPELGQPELSFPDSSINVPAVEGQKIKEFPGNIFVQLNISNLDTGNTKNCLMTFALSETHSNLTLTRANFEECMSPRGQNITLSRPVEWLKQMLMKILNFFEAHTRSFSRILPQWDNPSNVSNGSRSILFPTSISEPSIQNASFDDGNATSPLELLGAGGNVSISSLREENLLLNVSENGDDHQDLRADLQNDTSSGPRRPKMVSNNMILSEINARANHTSGASGGLFLNNYTQESPREGAVNSSTCSLQTRWSKVEHLRRAIELLLLSVPVSLKEMREASAHPFLEDFIFRPEGRSIFAVMSTCAKCYMKDPLGRCREVLFCKDGVTVSSRILG